MTGCSSNFGISELAVQATSEFQSWLFEQLRNCGVGCSNNSAKAPPVHPLGRVVHPSGAPGSD
eukprot:15443316-Alexandrium_andersonii.AAC.1